MPDPNQGLKYLARDNGGTRHGTAKDDLLLGGPGPDVLRGFSGNDVLWGLRQAGLTSSEPDVLDAGPGDDTIYGGPGPQKIDAGSGDDFVNGGLGNGTISAGAGSDTVRLRGAGRVRVYGDSGNDKIYVNGPATGIVRCGKGKDTVYAGRNDTVARDCERIVAKAGSKPKRLRTAGRPAPTPARRVGATPRGASGSAYADVIRGTSGLAHYWRLGVVPGDLSAEAGSQGAFARDEVTGRQADAYGFHNEPGVTDDGDTAWLAKGAMSPAVSDAALRGPASTVEVWLRQGSTPAEVQSLVYRKDFIAVDLRSNGRIEAVINGGDRSRLRLGTAVGTVSRNAWHHVAIVRDGETARIWVNGVLAASAPDVEPPDGEPSLDWYVGGFTNSASGTPDGLSLDELAVYDRALGVAELDKHRSVGDDGTSPVTRLDPPIPALIPGRFETTLSTERAGSSFRCRLDDVVDMVCGPRLVLRSVPAGRHALQISVVDRFGRPEAAPVTSRFTVDRTVPSTVAVALLGVDPGVPSLLTFGSDDPDATFECQYRLPPSEAYGLPNPSVPFAPCTAPAPLPDADGSVAVRAVDPAGNPDPVPASVALTPRRALAGGRPPGFGTVRTQVRVGSEEGAVEPFGFLCSLDGRPVSACPEEFPLRALHQGPHELRYQQRVKDLPAPIVVAPLRWTVAPPPGRVRLATAQFATVVESSANLSRRVPRVRLALDRPARLVAAIVDARERKVATFEADGAAGANTVKVPAAALRRLRLGRYTLVVGAQVGTSVPDVQRLPFAVIPRHR